jgi:hypothetical protein
MKIKKKNIKIVECDLSRENVWGWAYKNENLIEIEKTLKGKERLKTLVHELCHHAFRKAKEPQIIKAEQIIADALWKENYRKVDN